MFNENFSKTQNWNLIFLVSGGILMSWGIGKTHFWMNSAVPIWAMFELWQQAPSPKQARASLALLMATVALLSSTFSGSQILLSQ